MKKVRATLIERLRRTDAVESFRFATGEPVDFIPGQFLRVIFDEKNVKNRMLNKYLSFSCAPGKGHIEVTKKISDSAFSARLLRLKRGDSVTLEAPLGNCVFLDEYRKIAFLIGGIGITPVISILEYIADAGLPTDVCLLYSNRTEDQIAFREELDAWNKCNGNIKVIHAVNSGKPKDDNFFVGIIDKDFLLEHVPDYRERVFFIFGPPAMVKAMKGLCTDIGCVGGSVKTETFVGY